MHGPVGVHQLPEHVRGHRVLARFGGPHVSEQLGPRVQPRRVRDGLDAHAGDLRGGSRMVGCLVDGAGTDHDQCGQSGGREPSSIGMRMPTSRAVRSAIS
jgi:hypothetical protein